MTTQTRTNVSDMTVIEDFMETYQHSLYRDYIEVSRQGAQTISKILHDKHIKHEIFHRGKAGLMEEGQTDLAAAKGLDSTRKTIVRRLHDRLGRGKDPYKDSSEIVKEMHDLAGIRVAIYYPNDFEKVENLIRYNFREVSAPQDWPDRDHGPYPYSLLDRSENATRDITGRHSRFPGYFSRHFRVQFRTTAVPPDDVKDIDDYCSLAQDIFKTYDDLKSKDNVEQEDDVEQEYDVEEENNIKQVDDIEQEDSIKQEDDVSHADDVKHGNDVELRLLAVLGLLSVLTLMSKTLLLAIALLALPAVLTAKDDVKHENDVKHGKDDQGKTLEIQVMSILMHSWSMINQELVYKPNASIAGAADAQRYVYGESGWTIHLGPEVDEDDQRLLDIANGIVIAGEQVLRQLQTNLDSKMRRQQHPERKVWTKSRIKFHINVKWVLQGDMYGLSEHFMMALRLGIQRRERMQSIFASWRNLGAVDDKMVDRHIEGALRIGIPVYLPGDAGVDIVLNLLFISTVRWRNFLSLETKRRNVSMSLMLANDINLNRFATRTEATQYVRYEALVVCNAMRFLVLKCKDYDEFKSQVDSWKSHRAPMWEAFMMLIHPGITEKLSDPTLLEIHQFCNGLIHARTDHRWESYCARGRLGVVHLVRADMWRLHLPAMCSVCPSYFVQYLGGGVSNRTVQHRTFYYKPVTATSPKGQTWELFKGEEFHLKFLKEGLEKQHSEAVKDSEKEKKSMNSKEAVLILDQTKYVFGPGCFSDFSD